MSAVVRATPQFPPAIVELSKNRAPPEVRRILMQANIIGSDGLLPEGIESVEITCEKIILIPKRKGYLRDIKLVSA